MTDKAATMKNHAEHLLLNDMENPKDHGRLERVRLHLANVSSRELYAIQRIDLLVISVSGAGIYIVFETMKFVIQNGYTINRSMLIWCGALFAASILLNFISQWAGYYVNKVEARWAALEHKKASGGTLSVEEERDQCESDVMGRIYSLWTRILNIASTITMLIAVILLLILNVTSFVAA